MNESQKRIVALALYAVALVLFVFFFGLGFWEWASWNADKGTLDLGIIKVTNRPPFPNDARSIVAGLILPIILAATGRVMETSKRP
jgi:hypothetical protein